MENRVEHHLFPQLPFHALPALRDATRDQLPEPDPGSWRTNLEAPPVAVRRSPGRDTKTWTIRQVPHMISAGGHEKLSVHSSQ